MAAKCQYAGKKRAKKVVTFMKGRKRIRFRASSGCAPKTKQQRRLAAAAKSCKAKGISPVFRKGSTWSKCMKKAL